MKFEMIFIWVLRLAVSGILGMTLFYKFSADPQSVRLFTTLGMEPWGRIGTGVLEFITVILILYPRTTGYGAILGLCIMSGALYFHLTKLGIVYDGDALLFIYALSTFICCALLLFYYRHAITPPVNLP